jgi:hypothetical protein
MAVANVASGPLVGTNGSSVTSVPDGGRTGLATGPVDKCPILVCGDNHNQVLL